MSDDLQPLTAEQLLSGPALANKVLPAAVPLAARVVVVCNVYHQARGEQPTGKEWRSSRWISGDDEPYQRGLLEVGREWRPLDLGWVAEPGLLALSCRKPEQGAASSDVLVGVEAGGVVTPIARVRAGDAPLLIEPLQSLHVRAEAGKALLALLACPK